MPKRSLGLNLGKVEEVLTTATKAEKGQERQGPPRTPKEEAERTRSRRHNIFASGAHPYGEKRINPARKETAYDYDEWSKTQQSHSIHEGAYRDMLESEERHIGRSSYPPGHPREEQAKRGYKAGRTVADLVASQEARLTPQGPSGPSRNPGTGFGNAVSAPRPKVEKTPEEASQETVRVNRFRAKCSTCGEDILVGQGRMVRQPTRWVTVHNPKCP